MEKVEIYTFEFLEPVFGVKVNTYVTYDLSKVSAIPYCQYVFKEKKMLKFGLLGQTHFYLDLSHFGAYESQNVHMR